MKLQKMVCIAGVGTLLLQVGAPLTYAEVILSPKGEQLVTLQQSDLSATITTNQTDTQADLSVSSMSKEVTTLTAEVWTIDDKSDKKELTFEKTEENDFKVSLNRKEWQTDAEVHVLIKAALPDGSVQEFKDYTFKWTETTLASSTVDSSSTKASDIVSTTTTSSSVSASSTEGSTSSTAAATTTQTETSQAHEEKVAAINSATVTMTNLNTDAGSFDVIISNVKSSAPLAKVQVPVWTSENGQDDLKWYTADKQADGTYKVTVQKANHKNGAGEYNVHLYFSFTNGKTVGVSATKTSMAVANKGTLSIENMNTNAGSFDIVVSNVYSSSTIRTVYVPVWTENNGQDDLKWYTATKQANGTYRVTVQKSNHKNDVGLYKFGLYYVDGTGSLHGVTSSTTKLEVAHSGKIAVENMNAQKGTFDVRISGVSSNAPIQSVKIPVWTENAGQDDLKWYTAEKQTDGTYLASIDKANHKNETGTYQIHLYYQYADGLKGVTGTSAKLAEPKVAGKLTIQNVDAQTGTFDVIISEVASPKGVSEVQVPVWSDKKGQDDISWHTATKQADGTYKVTISASQHKYDTGLYHVHLYYKQLDGKMVGVASTTTNLSVTRQTPSAIVSITNVNQTYGSFDVVVSNIFAPKGVDTIRVPVWADVNGQNDINWYTAERQQDGTYSVTVRIANHKYETGKYHAHAYITSAGVQYGVATTTGNITYTKKSGQAFVDVSSHNGTISVDDYRDLIRQGVSGVVVKLTEGTSYTNPYAAMQIANAQAAGLKVSAYHYSHFSSPATAQAEAAYFVAAAKKLGLGTNTVMVNDIEDKDSRVASINENMKAWEAAMKRLGYTNLIHYAGASWIDANNLGYSGSIKTGQFGLSNFWVAQYPYVNGMSADQARLMGYYALAAAWQFTSKAALLSGHSNFDMNLDYTGRFTN